MKKVFFICVSILLFMTGCSGSFNEEKATGLIEKYYHDSENFTEADANEMVKQLELLDKEITPMIQDYKENGTDNLSERNRLASIRYELSRITECELAKEYPDIAEKSRQISIEYGKFLNKE